MSVNEKMTAIADAIREKTNLTEPLTLDDMAKNIPLVYGNGYVAGNEDGFANGEEHGKIIGYEEGFVNGETSGHAAGLEEGYSQGYFEGYSEGEEEGLEYTLNGLIEITKIQESYLAEPMSFYIMSMVTYEAEKIECMTSDTWEDIVANDYNGIISQDGIYIDEYDNYVKYLSGSYLRGYDGSYCKSYKKPVHDMTYQPHAEEPTEQGGE